MPAKIDLVGRAHELKTRYLLKPTSKNKIDLDRVLLRIKEQYPTKYKRYYKRIDVGSKHSTDFIKKNIVRERKIKEVDYRGEKSKGISDVDLLIRLSDRSEEDISLKLYKPGRNFNLWNPTLETLFEHLTGNRFSDYLNASELSKYLKEMKSLKKRSVRSKEIALKWVKKATAILANFHKKNPKFFRESLIKKLGYASIIIAPIVDEEGNFKKIITTHPKLIEKLAKGKGVLKITSSGISINVLIDNERLTSFAVYAQSGSKGRSGGLRIATWTPYF